MACILDILFTFVIHDLDFLKRQEPLGLRRTFLMYHAGVRRLIPTAYEPPGPHRFLLNMFV